LPSVPSAVAQWINEAAKGTGLPEAVVAAQNYDESGYGSNEGPSSAGAEGPWQFEPATFASYGSGSITSWSDSTAAYVKYMNSLLSQYGGNVRNALAAYNAGPGNLSAGYSYADEILSQAGQSQSLKQGQAGSPAPASSGGGGTSSLGDLGALGTIATNIGNIGSSFADVAQVFTYLGGSSSHQHWLRIGAFFAGIVLLIIAIYTLTRSSGDAPRIPIPIPMPI